MASLVRQEGYLVALADELEIESQIVHVNRCKVCHWVSRLGEDDARSYAAWIANGRDLAKLYRAAARIDPPVPCAYSTFARHVRECR